MWVGLSLVLVLWLVACSRIVAGGGTVGGTVPLPLDGQGRQRPEPPPIGERIGERPADGLVSGRITAAEGSTYESVIVELFEAPARIVHSVRAYVNEEYNILYSSSLVNCGELAVRFVISSGLTPRVKHLGGCGRHVVNHEIPPDE